MVAAQVARGLFRSADHRVLLPAAILIGATLGLAADLVVHLPWSRHVFHLNEVIGLIGAPIALWVLLMRRGFRRSSSMRVKNAPLSGHRHCRNEQHSKCRSPGHEAGKRCSGTRMLMFLLVLVLMSQVTDQRHQNDAGD